MGEEEGRGFFTKEKIIIVLLILIIIAAVAIYITFFYAKAYNNFASFQTSMEKCIRATYVNEDGDATWKYKIMGMQEDMCKINVKLLQAKTGELGMEKLTGYDMDCFYYKGIGTYPEKDLAKCHGRLKEELQTIIIKKLHNYILGNLGELKDELNKI